MEQILKCKIIIHSYINYTQKNDQIEYNNFKAGTLHALYIGMRGNKK